MTNLFNKTAFATLLTVIVSASVVNAGSIAEVAYINDNTEKMIATLNGGSAGVSIIQEGIGQLGVADFSFEYLSTNPLAPGVVEVFNFNMIEPGTLSTVSDTLNIVLTGHTPSLTDPSNVSVDMHFRSDSLDDIAPPPLANATNIGEFISFSPLHDNFTVTATSAPEPSSLALLGLGGLGLAIRAYRRRRAATI